MPTRAPRPCNHTGCPKVSNGRYCDDHKPLHKHNWQSDKVRGNRHQRGYGREWERRRKVVLNRDSYLCQPCEKQDKVSPANTVDHIVSKDNGGTDDYDNLQSICDACHAIKTAQERKSNTNTN